MRILRKFWGLVKPKAWRVVNRDSGWTDPDKFKSREAAQDHSSLMNEVAQFMGLPNTYEVRWM